MASPSGGRTYIFHWSWALELSLRLKHFGMNTSRLTADDEETA